MILARSIASPRTMPRTMPRTSTRPEPQAMPRLVIAGAIAVSLFFSLGSTRLWWPLNSAHAAAPDDATEFPDLEAFAKTLAESTPGARFETFGPAAGAPPRPLIVLADPAATPATAKAPKPGSANDRLVVLAVADLSGDDGESREGLLLLAHGVMDDNVHVQNSLQLLGALQDANKFVETQFYPRARHGVPQGHVSRLTFDFMVRHLR